MKIKSRCVVCNGKGKVIDKLTDLPRTCVFCKGNKSVVVEYLKSEKVIKPKGTGLRLPIQDIIAVLYEYQREYFERGPMYLRPMRLRDLADILGIDHATVCIKLKGVEIDGVPVQQLFSHDINGISTKVIKEMVRQELQQPLSDLQVTNILHARGIHIARRTVTQYRLALGIDCITTRNRK